MTIWRVLLSLNPSAGRDDTDHRRGGLDDFDIQSTNTFVYSQAICTRVSTIYGRHSQIGEHPTIWRSPGVLRLGSLDS